MKSNKNEVFVAPKSKILRAILLRVGIDKGTDGCLAPIFEDQSFEYIPLSELNNTTENRTYNDVFGRKGKLLASYLPHKVKTRKIHFDPEFETFTYGDMGAKAKWLLKLKSGDLIIFYAGLTPYNHDNFHDALYIIAYFTVSEVIDFLDLSIEEKEKYCHVCSNNAHVKRHDDLESTVIVMGNGNKSKLLDKAILISEPLLNKIGRRYHAASKEMEDLIGIKGSIQRSIPPRIITSSPYIKNLKKLINYNDKF